METVDRAIEEAAKAIDGTIELTSQNPGLMSKLILSQSRNLIEALALKASGVSGATLMDYDEIHKLNWNKLPLKARFMAHFHSRLQVSSSHYTVDEESSERLVASYLDYLYSSRTFAKTSWGMTILQSLDKIPLYDDATAEFYRLVIQRLKQITLPEHGKHPNKYYYYVESIIPRFVHGQRLYEMELVDARDNTIKTDRKVAYSLSRINQCYCVEVDAVDDIIATKNGSFPVSMITSWRYSIRPCEMKHLGEVFGIKIRLSRSSKTYAFLMDFLTKYNCSLLDIVKQGEIAYLNFLTLCPDKDSEHGLGKILNASRAFINEDKPGSNIVRYLLAALRNRLIKNQLSACKNDRLSELYLTNSCIPFDAMPFCSQPYKTIAKPSLVLEAIDGSSRQCEFLVSLIQNAAEKHGVMFTPANELGFQNEHGLIADYNSRLYRTHTNREIVLIQGNGVEYAFQRQYVDDLKTIMDELLSLSKSKPALDFSSAFQGWKHSGAQLANTINEEKKEVLSHLFDNDCIEVVVGCAGSGKTTLLACLADILRSKKILFLAQTNSAVENIRRTVANSGCEYRTIDSLLNSGHANNYDLVVIDEGGVVSNTSMRRLLCKLQNHYDLLFITGDSLQLDPIRFGNWFELTRRFLPTASFSELHTTLRTNSEAILTLWDLARYGEKHATTSRYSTIQDYLLRNGMVHELNESLLSKYADDEIILCLGYNGQYGINSINRLMQETNRNPAILWNGHIYKIGDPVLFTDTTRFNGLLYRNEKGVIRGIDVNPDRIVFDVEIEYTLTANEISAARAEMRLSEKTVSESNLIRIVVFKRDINSDDEDLRSEARSAVPFQIAYAVSIHKAQGLQYESVKLVVPDRNNDMLNANLFYTAITRTKKYLNIYWPQNVADRFFSQYEFRKTSDRDYGLFRQCCKHPEKTTVLCANPT